MKIEYCTRSQLRAHLRQQLQRHYGNGLGEKRQAIFRLLGIIPPQSDLIQASLDVLATKGAAFYDPQASRIWFNKGTDTDGLQVFESMFLAHELAHALDDQYIDIGRLIAASHTTIDREMAVVSVIEGSATVLMQRYAQQFFQKSWHKTVSFKALRSGLARGKRTSPRNRTQQPAAAAPQPNFRSTVMASYFAGSLFLKAGIPDGTVKKSVGKQLLLAGRQPPLSTEQILHPQKYWSEEKRDLPVVFDDSSIEGTLETAKVGAIIHRDCIGELLCAAIVGHEWKQPSLLSLLAGGSRAWTNEAAAGWGGDRFFLMAESPSSDPASAVSGIWITAWDTGQDREEFINRFTWRHAFRQESILRLGHRTAIFAFGMDSNQRREVFTRLLEAGLIGKKDGKAWEL